ncbi:hypothetical protein O181_033567 [Austropuccinia psidii MF-1]|uniref:Uncharacterized protein n=1 Tax=Austropuccinia psidii MF-1 TaxID=1389203 RepID=A0A9Q3D1M4_9BASI|nr:hypothetical protein [Austropuccinia psidii MF-1]
MKRNLLFSLGKTRDWFRKVKLQETGGEPKSKGNRIFRFNNNNSNKESQSGYSTLYEKIYITDRRTEDGINEKSEEIQVVETKEPAQEKCFGEIPSQKETRYMNSLGFSEN